MALSLGIRGKWIESRNEASQAMFALFVSFCIFCFSPALFCRPALAQSPGKPLVLPTKYEEHRFYVQPITIDGTKLNLYTDSGGGLFIYRDVAERLGLSIVNIGGEGQNAFYIASLPTFKAEATIPAPLTREGRIPVWSPLASEREPSTFIYDGMLGQEWFGGRVWTFDYPN